MKAQMQKGFTLIELMIVVAIIGILAAVAIPQYQNYIAKSQISRVMGEVSSVRTAVEEILLRGGKPTAIASNDGPTDFFVGFNADRSNLVSTFTVDGTTGTMAATLGGSSAAAVTGAIVNWTRTAEGVWNCTVTKSSNGGWKNSFAPAGCAASN